MYLFPPPLTVTVLDIIFYIKLLYKSLNCLIVQLLSCVWLSATPWTVAHQASLSFTISWSLLTLMSIELVMPFNHLILVHPLLLLLSIFPSIGVFSNESWFPLDLARLISLLCNGLSGVFSSTRVRKHQFFGAQPSLWPNSHIHTWLLEKS